ncbi:MAG: hypothetical protein WCT31_01645 [Candidatus Micrarchaeia archaeon]|jgi:hypothetical protein
MVQNDENDVASQMEKIKERLEDEGLGQVEYKPDEPDYKYKLEKVNKIFDTPISQKNSVVSILAKHPRNTHKENLQLDDFTVKLPKDELHGLRKNEVMERVYSMMEQDIKEKLHLSQKTKKIIEFLEPNLKELTQALLKSKENYLDVLVRYYPCADNALSMDTDLYDVLVEPVFIDQFRNGCIGSRIVASIKCYFLENGNDAKYFYLDFILQLAEFHKNDKFSEPEALDYAIDFGLPENIKKDKEALQKLGMRLINDSLELGFDPNPAVWFAGELDYTYETSITANLTLTNDTFGRELVRVLNIYKEFSRSKEFEVIFEKIKELLSKAKEQNLDGITNRLDDLLKEKFDQQIQILQLLGFQVNAGPYKDSLYKIMKK